MITPSLDFSPEDVAVTAEALRCWRDFPRGMARRKKSLGASGLRASC